MEKRERYSTRSYAVTKSRKRKNQLMLTIALLVLMFIAVVAGGIYSYWAGTILAPTEATRNRDITVGQAENVTTTIDITEALGTKKLVPPGMVAVSVGGADDNVDSFVDTFNVTWSETGTVISASDNISGTLAVTATPSLTGTDAVDYSTLVNVTVNPASSAIVLDGTAVPVTVTVTLTEPANATVYNAIINQTITLDLTFNVTP